MAGDRAQWLEYLKLACQSGPRQREQVLGDLVAGWPDENLPALVDDILRQLQPDLQSARFLYGVCLKRCAPEQLAPLADYRARRAEIEAPTLENTEAASVWLEAQQLYSQLGDDTAALRCVGNALQCDAGDYNAHYQGALCLLRQGMFAQAESHARWCLQRTPNDQSVANLLREALKGRLDGPRRAATEKEGPVTR